MNSNEQQKTQGFSKDDFWPPCKFLGLVQARAELVDLLRHYDDLGDECKDKVAARKIKLLANLLYRQIGEVEKKIAMYPDTRLTTLLIKARLAEVNDDTKVLNLSFSGQEPERKDGSYYFAGLLARQLEQETGIKSPTPEDQTSDIMFGMEDAITTASSGDDRHVFFKSFISAIEDHEEADDSFYELVRQFHETHKLWLTRLEEYQKIPEEKAGSLQEEIDQLQEKRSEFAEAILEHSDSSHKAILAKTRLAEMETGNAYINGEQAEYVSLLARNLEKHLGIETPPAGGRVQNLLWDFPDKETSPEKSND